MATKRSPKLTDEHRAFLVQQLACFSHPTTAAAALNETYGISITPQAVERYDPTKSAGARIRPSWRALFEHTRAAFLEHIENHVPHAHKAVRVKKLARAADTFEQRGNYMAMADMLERIAKEMGNVHTNRREHTGANGKPMQYQDVMTMTAEQLDAELAQLLSEAELRKSGH